MTLPIAQPPQDAGRFQRTVSMPVMASALSDISERSNEPEQVKRSLEIPQDSSPDRSISQASVVAVHGTTIGDQSTTGQQRQPEETSQEQVKKSQTEREQLGKESTEMVEIVGHESPKKRYTIGIIKSVPSNIH